MSVGTTFALTDTVLNRWFSFITFLSIGVVVYFLRKGITYLLSESVENAASSPVLSRRYAVGQESFAPRTGAELLAHNPFDSTKRSRAMSPSVCLSQDTQVCQSLLFARPEPLTEEPVGVDSAALPAESVARVQKVGEAEFIVERVSADQALEHLSEGMKIAHVVPAFEDGGANGIRVSGIRAGSLSEALGLQNGDRLDALNEFELRNSRGALEAYASLRNASKITLHLTRRGRPLNIVVHVK